MKYSAQILFIIWQYLTRIPTSLAILLTPHWFFESIVLAHALKSPLTSLSLAISEARRANPTSKQLSSALAQADTARAQLQQLLLQPTDLETRYFSIYEVVTRLSHRHLASGQQVRVVWSSDAVKKHKIKGSEFMFEQFVHLLLQNAIRAGKPGSTIVLSLTVEAELVHLLIQDFGTGMSTLKLWLTRLSACTSQGDGWGIGLLCARRILHSFRGKLRIRSLEHIGTQVICTLPLDRG